MCGEAVKGFQGRRKKQLELVISRDATSIPRPREAEQEQEVELLGTQAGRYHPK